MTKFQRLTINMLPEDHEALKASAAEKDTSITEYLKTAAALFRLVNNVAAETGLIIGKNEAGEEFPIIVDVKKYAEQINGYVIT